MCVWVYTSGNMILLPCPYSTVYNLYSVEKLNYSVNLVTNLTLWSQEKLTSKSTLSVGQPFLVHSYLGVSLWMTL